MALSDPKVVAHHFALHDPHIARLLPSIDFSTWFEPVTHQDHFYNLTRNIIYQQLAGKAASTIFGRFKTLLENKVDPEHVLKFENQAFRDVGLSWAKAKYVKDLATKVAEGRLDMTKLDSLSKEDVIKELTMVKGIGVWTAEMFLLFTLHCEDIFSHGDLGLKKGFAKLYEVNNPTKEDIEPVVKRWSPYQSYGSIVLWHHLDNS